MATICILERPQPTTFRPAPNTADLALLVNDTAWLIRTVLRGFRRQHSGLGDVELGIVLALGTRGDARRCDLSGWLAIDRSQVGRGVKTLTELGIISSTRRRVPVSLTPVGCKVFETIASLTEHCERQLLSGLSRPEMAAVTATLRGLCEAVAEAFPMHESGGAQTHLGLIGQLRLTSRTMRRSAQVDSDGIGNLSAFEADVLSRLGRRIASLTILSHELNRDKAQLCRVIATLKQAGLVMPVPSDDRQIWLGLTRRGHSLNRQLTERSTRRACAHLAEIEADAADCLETTLQRLGRNALAFQETVGGQGQVSLN